MSRIAHAALAVGTVLFAWWLHDQPHAPPTSVIVIGAVALAYVFVRGAVMGVVLEDDHIVVRGLLYSRRIPISSITSVTYLPAVKWKSASGRSHWTPVSALMAAPRNTDASVNKMLASADDLRFWVRDHQGYAGTV
jgi:hypothetical protein